MKELNQYELENVSGGFLPLLIAAVAVSSAYGGYQMGKRSR